MGQNKKYWGSLEELHETPEFLENQGKEFLTPPPEQSITSMERRSFLKVMGAGLLMASLQGCRKPVEKIIPYVNRPEEIIPGVANWYASTCSECSASCGLVVKTREGRPLKVEGNKIHPLSQGGLCAQGQASVIGLYDPHRLKGPVKVSQGQTTDVSWTEADNQVKASLDKAKTGGQVAILSGVVTSPSTTKLIKDFLANYPGGRHVAYDGAVPEEIALGQELAYGQKITPHYRLDKADVVVSFGADFLGTYLSPVEFSKNFSAGRRADNGRMSRLICIEPALTLTGSNADEYFPVAPGDELKIALALANDIIVRNKIGSAGSAEAASLISSYTIEKVADETGISVESLKKISALLIQSRGKGLVLGGPIKGKNALALQVVTNLLNSALENDGATIDYSRPSHQADSSFSDLATLVEDMKAGKISTLLIYKTNPVYSLPASLKFTEALSHVSMVISFADRVDETGLLAHILCPDSHAMESWNDASPQSGVYSLFQPTIRPLYQTRAFQESLLLWMGSTTSWHDTIQNYWKQFIYPTSSGVTFDAFWLDLLQNGVYTTPANGNTGGRTFKASALKTLPSTLKTADLSFSLYPSVKLGDGSQANNAYLQELPDPLSKITWDNYLAISQSVAEKYSLSEGDFVLVQTETTTSELPVHIQPKMNGHSIMAAIGYGRTSAGPVGNNIGVNVYPFQKIENNFVEWSLPVTSFSKTGSRAIFSTTQGHQSMEGRSIVQEATFEEFKKDPHAGAEHTEPNPTLWPLHEYKGYRWGMAIDLNACTGCSGCVIGCQTENNIPVVGKDQVFMGRFMHWLRIDRYFEGVDSTNPNVVYQPMLCQQCENAPCETVCPVLATMHNEEGLNVQAYNRCVGTRYCANNCPYKVRRFNFLDFWKDLTPPENLRLNPDISTRSRGVMEKCNFCMQRIREGKDRAKDYGRSVLDGEIKTACQQSCPTDAIVFGNINDPDSLVSKLKKSPRGYHVLEELNVKPQVTYLRKLRNT